MATIEAGQVIEGAGRGYQTAGAPTDGTDEVQTITIGGTPDGGTFTLTFDGHTTAPITWTATDATLVAAVDTALGALPNINGAANVTVADTTITSGVGDMSVTFVVQQGKRARPLMTATSSLTGTDPTVSVAETTPGVTASARGAPKGALLTDTTNGILYINTGTAIAPTWTQVGDQ